MNWVISVSLSNTARSSNVKKPRYVWHFFFRPLTTLTLFLIFVIRCWRMRWLKMGDTMTISNPFVAGRWTKMGALVIIVISTWKHIILCRKRSGGGCLEELRADFDMHTKSKGDQPLIWMTQLNLGHAVRYLPFSPPSHFRRILRFHSTFARASSPSNLSRCHAGATLLPIRFCHCWKKDHACF